MTNQYAYLIHQREHNERTNFAVIMLKDQGICSTPVQAKKRLSFFSPYQTYTKKNRIILQDPINTTTPLTAKSLYCGLYLNELIYKACKPGDAHPYLYTEYEKALEQIRQKSNLEKALRQFELAIIKACGYELSTHHIQEPYVFFNPYDGLLGTHQPSQHTISLQELNNMLLKSIPSNEAKLFFRSVLNQILSTSLQSRLFYEKNS